MRHACVVQAFKLTWVLTARLPQGAFSAMIGQRSARTQNRYTPETTT